MSTDSSGSTGFQPVDLRPVGLRPFETDIDTANNLIAEWGTIAESIARQCKWRPKGQCLINCLGLAICNLEGLTLVDNTGRPVAGQEPAP